MPMAMSTREIGLMIKLMAAVFTIMLMEPDTKETGKRISNMAKEKRSGLMGLAIQGGTLKGRNKALENLNGPMVLLIAVNLTKTTLRA